MSTLVCKIILMAKYNTMHTHTLEFISNHETLKYFISLIVISCKEGNVCSKW